MFRLTLFALTLLVSSVFAELEIVPDNLCFPQTGKNYHADPKDCHFFYQCRYYNGTYADSIRQKCAKGFFWHDQVLSCMPEGKEPCKDRCLDDTKGCYAGTGCGQFFMCSNTASYGMCCPEGTRFNEPNCTCLKDHTCKDTCVQVAPPVPTTMFPPEQISATVCEDSFGNPISTVPGTPNAYIPLDDDGLLTQEMLCPGTTVFSLATCRCEVVETSANLGPIEKKRQAIFWASFDQDLMDHSINKFVTLVEGEAERDATIYAQGTGSLRLNGGQLSIAGLKTFDLRNEASFCAFFKCQDGSWSSKGGILANYKDENEFTLTMTIDPPNILTARLHFWHPLGAITVKSPIQVPTNGWNHACLIYDGNKIQLFANAGLVDTQSASGYLSLSHVPFVLGGGSPAFKGHIDDVIVAPFAMTQDEINAHRTGDRDFLNKRGFELGNTEQDNIGQNLKPASSTGRKISRKGRTIEFYQLSYAFILQNATYEEASNLCQQINGTLGKIASQEELNRVIEECKAGNLTDSSFWFGLTKTENKSDEYKWIDDDILTDWTSYLPLQSDQTVYDGPKCGQIVVSTDGKVTIKMASCGEKIAMAMCEFFLEPVSLQNVANGSTSEKSPIQKRQVESQTLSRYIDAEEDEVELPTNASIPLDGPKYELPDRRDEAIGQISDKIEYMLVEMNSTWNAGQAMCKGINNGTLGTITSQENLNKAITTCNLTNVVNEPFWIGLTKIKNKPNVFEWVDGTDFEQFFLFPDLRAENAIYNATKCVQMVVADGKASVKVASCDEVIGHIMCEVPITTPESITTP